MDNELLTVKEVAKLLRLTPQTLYNWRALGIGPRSIKVGRSVRYLSDDLQCWLDEQE